MKPETKDFLDRLTLEERADLYAGLKRRHLQDTAKLAGPAADMLIGQLQILGLEQETEYLKDLRDRLYDMAWGIK